MEGWEQIVTLLEDLEDAEELGRRRAVQEETIPWNIARKELNLYRVLDDIHDSAKVVTIYRIKHRREVYQR